MSVGVWVGNHDNTPMDSITSQQTGPILTQFVRDAYATKKYEDKPIFDKAPDGIQKIALDANTGYVATSKTKNKYIGLFPSWFNKDEKAGASGTYTIDKVSGKTATECTPELAKEERTGGGLWPEILPSDPWFGAWAKTAGYGTGGAAPTEKDDVHKCSDQKPSVSLSSSALGGGKYKLTASVSKGTHGLKTLNFKVGGQIVSSVSVGHNGSYSYTYTASGGTKSATAQIIDAALYDDTSNSISLSGGSSSGSISLNSSGGPGKSQRFTWSPSGGSFTLRYRKSGSSGWTTIDNAVQNFPYTMPSNGDYEAYITSSDGKGSNTVSYTIN
jgi:hypothetical protein